MDDGRARQIALWASWTPAQRLKVMGRMSATVLALRDHRMRRQMPDATDAQFRQARIAATLAASPHTV